MKGPATKAAESALRAIKRPGTKIVAFQWKGDGNNQADLENLWKFCPTAAWCGVGPGARLEIPTKDGDRVVEHGDWIFKEDDGSFSRRVLVTVKTGQDGELIAVWPGRQLVV